MAIDRYLQDMPDFDGKSAGSVATVKLPNRGTYFYLQLAFNTSTAGGATQAIVEDEAEMIRLKLNGRTMQEFTARELIDMNAFKGIGTLFGDANNDAILHIPLAQPDRAEIVGEDYTAWGMGGIDTFTVEVKLKAGGGVPTLTMQALWSPITNVIGEIIKVTRSTVQSTAASNVQHALPLRDKFYAMHLDMAGVTVNRIDLDANKTPVLQGKKRNVDEFYKVHSFVPQADWFHVSLDKITGRVGHFLDLEPGRSQVSDFRATINRGRGAIPVLEEYLGTVN